MPNRAPRICGHGGCGVVTTEGLCDKHKISHGWGGDAERGNRHERGYGTKWDKLRLKVLKRDHYQCQQCAKQNKIASANQVDHIIPKARGGDDSFINLQSLCVACHRQKTIEER